jgi:omega-6 fatty acid desaturase (delta-12 desaturase)
VPAVAAIKLQKRSIVVRHARPDDIQGAIQVLSTLLPVIGLWCALAPAFVPSQGLVLAVTIVMSLFLLRVFVLMHDCGHGSLFRSAFLNRLCGFIFGVLSSMPQFVWAQHHNYHHSTNGNWAKYRGPLTILTVDEYDALSAWRKWTYVRGRNIWLAPLGGFMYLILNPRLTWIKGSLGLVWHLVRGKATCPRVSFRALAGEFRTPYWKSAEEYRHMTLNNLVLLSSWALMSWLIGPGLFFFVYILSTSLAGGAGIVLFTVQHNFEHSYASGDQGWDYDAAALEGSSFLILPAWLNWLTANIGYHHIHHLSAKIPNYRLAGCHAEHQGLFASVKRLTLADILPSLKFLLWDPQSRRIISMAEYELARGAPL